MNMKNRFYYILLLTLALLGLLTGCAPKQGGQNKQTEVPVQTVAIIDDETTAALTKPQTQGGAEETAQYQTEQATETVTDEPTKEPAQEPTTAKAAIDENGSYTSKEEVALYLHTYGHLPSNFITKNDAKALGWDSSKGNLWSVAPGKSIGGDYFGNYENLLPKRKGRSYYECDIDYDGGYRGSKRVIYSNDGLVYYTEDHYKTFEQLY